MAYSTTYKPSPLSFGSPRSSPFHRPESPSSPSTTIRPSTPTQASTKPQTPSRLKEATTPEPITAQWTPSSQNLSSLAPREPPVSPTRSNGAGGDANLGAGRMFGTSSMNRPTTGNNNILRNADFTAFNSMNGHVLSQLPPSQVREMREAFQILDRDSDGQVTKDDVIDMLGSLGLNTSGPSLGPFFPPSRPSTVALPSYLSNLSTLLAPLSPSSELLAAFAAFDDDDSGQIDVSELRDALLHTGPEVGEQALNNREIDAVLDGWVGRRAFGKGLAGGAIREKGEVFRYREWVGNLGSVGKGGDEEEGLKEQGKAV
ncbi:hypothetical protein MMC13_007106 [Lambiella insularis]|nr:hypothetical protein [Lambiella insularis]